MTDPSVSVVITCYNQADVIFRTVNSVLEQDDLALVDRIVVVDDGSTDSSPSVLSRIAASSQLVEVVRQDNAFVSAARNRGIESCGGSHIAFLDGDDLWLPGRLAALRRAIGEAPDAGLHYVSFVEELPDGTRRQPFVRSFRPDSVNVLRDLFVHNASIIPSAAVIRRDVFRVVGGFDPSMAYNEEAEMWLRVASRFPLAHDSSVLVRKFVVDGSMGKQVDRRSAAQERTTEKIVALVPDLAPYKAQRTALLAYKRGVAELRWGDREEARRWLRRALRGGSSIRVRALARLLSSVLPESMRTA